MTLPKGWSLEEKISFAAEVLQQRALDIALIAECPNTDLDRLLEFVMASPSQLRADYFAHEHWLRYSGKRESGFFCDVGAGDGVWHSNSYFLEKAKGWSGILVEPNSLHWDKLETVRSSKLLGEQF